MTTPSSRVEVHADAEALATVVAGAFLGLLATHQDDGAIPQVGLTGGSIADAVHREIARLAPDSEVDWSRVDFFWGDERFVAAASDERNAVQARAAFLDALPVDPARVHEIPSTDDAPDVEAAAAAYAATIRERGSGELTLLMLGVGPDGHVASLFPGSPQLDVTGAVTVAVTDSPKPPSERVSLTFEALNRSHEVWFLVSGTEKAAAVGRALASPPADLHEFPAAGVNGLAETIWFLDRAAASEL